jgi:hypothetical protein
MRRLTLLAAALLLAILAAGAVWLVDGGQTPMADIEPGAPGLTTAVPTPASQPTAAPLGSERIALPLYRSDDAGLPPVDVPLRDSLSELQSAADAGNATAACRIAFIAMDCWGERRRRRPAEQDAAQADAEYARSGDVITAPAARRINEAPSALREYVQARIDAVELANASMGDGIRASARRCEGAPLVDVGEVAGRLRQAALAGQPDAVAAYTNGSWMTSIMGMDAARTPAEPAVPLDFLRDPSFLVWRREAAAIHQAGLEAGLIQAIEVEAMRNRMTVLDWLVRRDRVQQAAAVRALAALVGSGAPPSTATLGLDAEQAAEADRRADRWVAAARERQTQADPQRVVLNTMTLAGRLPTCD